jgi:hypothetical protein
MKFLVIEKTPSGSCSGYGLRHFRPLLARDSSLDDDV